MRERVERTKGITRRIGGKTKRPLSGKSGQSKLNKQPPKHRSPCFICNRPHWICDYPEKKSLNALATQLKGHFTTLVEEPQHNMGSLQRLSTVKSHPHAPTKKAHVRECDHQRPSRSCAAAKRLCLKVTKEGGTMKAANSPFKALQDRKEDTLSQAIQERLQEGPKLLSLYLGIESGENCGHSPSPIPLLLQDVLDELKDVMPPKLPKKLPLQREVDHEIKLEQGSKPPAMASYRMALPEFKKLWKQLKDLLDARCIYPSKAPLGVPVLFQKKKDGSLWMCIDYQALNKITIKNKHLIPLIANLFDQLNKAQYFTKFDLRSRYYQVQIAKKDKTKTAYVTKKGTSSKAKPLENTKKTYDTSWSTFKVQTREHDEDATSIGGGGVSQATQIFHKQKLNWRTQISLIKVCTGAGWV